MSMHVRAILMGAEVFRKEIMYEMVELDGYERAVYSPG